MHLVRHVFSALVLIGSIHVAAMDGDDTQRALLDDAAPLLGLKQETIKAIKSYQTFLVNSLGCCFSRALITIFEPQNHQKTLNNIARSTRLLSSITKCSSIESLAQQLTSFYEKCITDATTSKQAHQFLQSLAKIITEIEHDSRDYNDEAPCSICIERQKTMAGLPCGHGMCRICITDLRNAQKAHQCPICRAQIETYVAVDGVCASCESKRPDYCAECGHPTWCEDCYKNNKDSPCPICQTPNTASIRIYH